jgi:isopentenyldiphosphate isomerase
VNAHGSVSSTRTRLRRGDALSSQAEIDALAREWRTLRRETASADEPFPLVDGAGNARPGLVAPRWLCHLLGLRHASVHVVLVAPNGLLVLQKRSLEKDTAPGLLDTSVGGHVGTRTELAAAFAEMREELGLEPSALASPLEPLGAPFLAVDPRRDYVDAEVVTAYLGRLAPGALDTVRFTDGEVTRLVLAPLDEVWRLLSRGDRALAAGARAVLPRALARLES